MKYVDGVAIVVNENSNTRRGMTLGSYININIKDDLSTDEYRDDNGKFTILKSQLFMHEYGHYLQSQKYGWAFLPVIGIPSFFDTRKSKRIKNGLTTHDVVWYERNANKRAKKHFDIKDWDENDFPIKYPEFLNH